MSRASPEEQDPEGESPRWGWVTRGLRTALGLLVVVFIVYAARELWLRWEGREVEVRLWPVALSVLPLLGGAVLMAWGWTRLVVHIAHRRVPMKQAIALHLQSQLARYMPGKVGVPVVRMAGAHRLGVPARTLGASVFIEVLSSMPVGAVVSLALLGAVGMPLAGHDMEVVGRWAAGPAVLLALGTLVLVAVDRDRFPKFALRLLKLEGHGPLCPIELPMVHVGYWATWAVHGLLLGYAVGASSSLAIASMGLYILAPVAGFLAVAAPAGIGVREAIVSIGLAAQLGPAPALAAALLSRGISLLADVLAWGIAYLYLRATQQRT